MNEKNHGRQYIVRYIGESEANVMKNLKNVIVIDQTKTNSEEYALFELHDLIKKLSNRNITRLLYFARGLSKNGS